MKSGHYTAFMRHPDEAGTWLRKNDTVCEVVPDLPYGLHGIAYLILQRQPQANVYISHQLSPPPDPMSSNGHIDCPGAP
jgi:hypothetical protein